ncbi:MAG: Ig-like domain-containing protein [Thermodesulfobacteriota bacterium]|nr:Ig-like domain-containing protein [Thermodesulfobacteriota bacterium]
MEGSSNKKKWLAGVCAAIVASVMAGIILYSFVPGRGKDHTPRTAADRFSVAEGEELGVPAPGVLKNDKDPDGDTLTALLVSDVSKGQLLLKPDGSLSYRPQSDFSGKDRFSYRARDAINESEPTAVTITVLAAAKNGFDPPLTAGSGTMVPWNEIEVTYRYIGDRGADVCMTAHPVLSSGEEVPGYIAHASPIAKGCHSLRLRMELDSGHGTYLITRIRLTMRDTEGIPFYNEEFPLDHPWHWKG